jgi:hypothetical protein
MTITASTVRYIKLGQGGRWEEISFSNGELHFGVNEAPHDLVLTRDRERVRQYYMAAGRHPTAASEDVRELFDFYFLGADCLWVTFAREHMWWTFADPFVYPNAQADSSRGDRVRKSADIWINRDIEGEPLRIDRLSTRLTKVASYRRTICDIEAKDYLLRRINAVEEPIVRRCNEARSALVESISVAITSLHWADFETLVDLLFARCGWYRSSTIGGNMKLVDLVIEQPSTEERAAVQVKSSATQKVLDDYIAQTDQAEAFNRRFFVCHTPITDLAVPEDREDVHLWSGIKLAEQVVRLGLSDWVIEKVS